MELRFSFVTSPLLFFPGPASDVLELVGTGTVHGQNDSTEPFNGVCGPLREREYTQGGTLIGSVNNCQANEGNDTGNCRVFLLEAGKDSRENLNEVVHGFIFNGLFTGLFGLLCSALCLQNTPDALQKLPTGRGFFPLPCNSFFWSHTGQAVVFVLAQVG